MVAQLVRLKLTLMANTFRRSVWQTIGLVLGSLYALGIVVTVVVASLLGGWNDPVLTGDLLVVLGAVAVLGWWVLPIFLYGVDATLDPQRFVLYPIPRRTLLTGLTVAGAISVPGIATALTFAGTSLAWLRSPLALIAGVIGAAGGLAVCVLGARAWTTLLSPLMESRRSREVLTLAAFVPLLALSPAINLLAQRIADSGASPEHLRHTLTDLAAVTAWTPFGAPWGIAAAVHDGAWLVAIGRLAVLAASALLLAWLWDWSMRRSLERPPRVTAQRERVKGLGFFDRFPASRTGAVAARTATYWLRDPRYSGSLIVVPMLPVIMLVGMNSGGAEAAAVTGPVMSMLAPLTAWILGFSISNDIGYDYTAFSLHVATGLPGRADRWGRVIPVLVAGTPIVILYSLIPLWLSGQWGWLPAVLGLSLGTLLASLGVSSATSSRWVYPVAKPGESPFKQPQGATGATMVAQSINMGLAVLVCLPALVLAVLSVVLSGPTALVLGWVTLLVGLAVGLGVLMFGVRWGARTIETRSPELLQQVQSFA
ncbi:MAG: hypothetical protein LBB54_05125 [Cellulomonadaceae bacterium]|jgi:ABC-2 type transport system permease protein|nr:hypothetical protein [Cellulomonadaceae bacterium]